MIVLLSASAIVLAGLQAGINAPRSAFTTCLKAATASATQEKVPAEGFEAYLRTSCGSQIEAFKKASIAFDVKNGLSRKSATSGVEEMISGWLGDSIESYQFRLAQQSPAPKKMEAAAPVPAAAPSEPQQ